MLQGSERSRLRQQCCKAYCSCNNKVARDCACNNDVAKLGEITRVNNVARLRELVLLTTMSQGLSLLQQKVHKDCSDCACDDYVARFIDRLATTMLRSVTTPTMHFVSRYSVSTAIQIPKGKVAMPQQWVLGDSPEHLLVPISTIET